jgi:hypothetical protein
MKSSRQDERRKWPRLALAIPVFVRTRDEMGKEVLEFATVLNLSAGGMLVAVRRAVPPTTVIHLEIPSSPIPALVPLTSASRNLRAKALRSSPEDGYYLVGLKFSRSLGQSTAPNRVSKRKILSAV